MRRVLMVSFQFPPMAGSSGVQRALRFAQQLPALGWSPSVLTAHPRAHAHTGDDLLEEIPPELPVRRAFALDAARHLSIGGRYPGFLARPDRWHSWLLGAVPAGLRLIRQTRPDAIWSTYPIPTAHLVGYWLSRLSGLPWVADFRDPMAHDGYPADPVLWRSFAAVERKVFARAARCTFTTPGAARLYARRFPAAADRLRVIENGYSEAAFQQAVAARGARVVAIERFGADHNAMRSAAQRLVPSLQQADALFVPAAADTMPALGQALQEAGYNPSRVKPLGTGVWNDASIARVPAIQGGWFASPDTAGFNAFAGTDDSYPNDVVFDFSDNNFSDPNSVGDAGAPMAFNAVFATTTPEPSELALLAPALLGLVPVVRRKMRG